MIVFLIDYIIDSMADLLFLSQHAPILGFHPGSIFFHRDSPVQIPCSIFVCMMLYLFDVVRLRT